MAITLSVKLKKTTTWNHLQRYNIMKTINALAIAAVLSSLSFAGFAATEVQSTPAGQQKMGIISANAGPNLESLENALAEKADAMGATSFRITSATGPNNLHGTAVIYK